MIEDYVVYKSNVVLENQKELIEDLEVCMNTNVVKDFTWDYDKYNIFTLNPNSIVLHKLYTELVGFIKDFCVQHILTRSVRALPEEANFFWLQAWCNFHDNNAFEHSHNHWWPYHGYISIRPHNTTTCFENPQYEIKNEVGNIYIGQGFNRHFVRVDEREFDTPRITIGFNVKTTQIPSKHLGIIPI